MNKASLCMLVVCCKDYKPSHNWYYQKSGGYFYGAAKSPDSILYDEAILKEYDSSEDFVLMPECPAMSDEEAAAEIKIWCDKNGIPYIDDMENIEKAYAGYYRLF